MNSICFLLQIFLLIRYLYTFFCVTITFLKYFELHNLFNSKSQFWSSNTNPPPGYKVNTKGISYFSIVSIFSLTFAKNVRTAILFFNPSNIFLFSSFNSKTLPLYLRLFSSNSFITSNILLYILHI